MKTTVKILLSEPNLYFALGLSQGLLTHFKKLGVNALLSTNLSDKYDCDIVFLAAEQDTASLRYLTQRRTSPAHQRIFLLKEKPGKNDSIQFKELDGVFYRHQSMSWAMQIATDALHSITLPTVHSPRITVRRAPLTHREVQVLRYLASGQRACQIGRFLHISAKTVSGHKRNAMAKLGISRSPDLNYWLLRGDITQLMERKLSTCHQWNASANSLLQEYVPFPLLPCQQSEYSPNRPENDYA